MSLLKRQSRMISFRLSEDDYTGLKNLCMNAGGRSVSDVARDALRRVLFDGEPPNKLEFTLQGLRIRIERLELEMKRLAAARSSADD